jgi:hypothetical protein
MAWTTHQLVPLLLQLVHLLLVPHALLHETGHLALLGVHGAAAGRVLRAQLVQLRLQQRLLPLLRPDVAVQLEQLEQIELDAQLALRIVGRGGTGGGRGRVGVQESLCCAGGWCGHTTGSGADQRAPLGGGARGWLYSCGTAGATVPG